MLNFSFNLNDWIDRVTGLSANLAGVRGELSELNRSIDQLSKEIDAMSEDVQRLKDEVGKETAEDEFTAEVIDKLRQDVADLQAALAEVQPALEAARAGEAEAVNKLEETLQAVRDAADQLAEDNPRDETDPNAPYPDNTLPNELPGAGEGEPPVVNPLGTQRGQRGSKK